MTPLLSCFCVDVDLFSCKLGTWHIAPYHPGATSPAPGYFLLPRLNVTWQKKNLFILFLLLFITFWLFVCSDLTWLGQPPLSSWLSTNQSAPSRNCRRCSCSDIHTFCTWAYVVARGLIFGSCYNWAFFLAKITCCLSTCPCPAKTSLVTLNLARFLDPFNKPPLQIKRWGKRCLLSFTKHFYE